MSGVVLYNDQVTMKTTHVTFHKQTTAPKGTCRLRPPHDATMLDLTQILAQLR